MKNPIFILTLCVLLIVAVTSAQDFTAANGKTSISLAAGEATFSSPAGTISMSTSVDDTRFIPAAVEVVGDDVKYSSGEKSLYILPDPKVQQTFVYSLDGKLEDTITLKEPAKVAYQFALPEKAYLAPLDGGYKVVNPAVDERIDGYTYISQPFGSDANGQPVTFTYQQDGDTLVVVVPKAGDYGKAIVYPLAIDPMIDYRYDLRLLLHGNLESPSLSTSNFQDSSHNLFYPYPQLNSTSIPAGSINVNTSQAKYGNASMFFSGPMSNLTVADNDAFTFGTGNHSICGWIYWPYTVQEARLFYHATNANNYDYYSVSAANVVQIQHYRSGASVGSNAVSTNLMYPGIWNQVCFIKNGTVTTAYVNGTAAATTATQTGSYTDLTGPVRIGDSNGYYPSHYLDEVIVTNGGFAPVIADLQGEYPMYLNSTPYGGYADDNFTVSLLHMDGANDGTFFKDQVGNRTWTPTNAKTGTASCKFSPTCGNFSANSILTTPNNDVMNLGNHNFTIEFWLSGASSTTGTIYRGNASSGAQSVLITSTSGNLAAYASSTPGSWDIVNGLSFGASEPSATPSHYAFVRDGNTFSTYKNGFLVAKTTGSGSITLDGVKQIGQATGIIFFIDEFRISKGIARYTSNFTPQTDPFELIVNQSWTPTPDAAGTIPATIQFTDSTPSNAWTNNTYLWNFGDNTSSTLQNPSRIYTTAGMFNVSSTVMNNNMSTTVYHTVPIGAPDVDFAASLLTGTAALQVNFTDLSTNYTPITSYLIDFGDGTKSTDNPPWVHVYDSYGAFSVNLTETNSVGTGYNYKRDYIIVSTEQGDILQSYTPWDVRIRIVDYYGKPLPGTNVTANYLASSLPNTSTDWLVKAYTIDDDVAADMVNSGVSAIGNTDDNGGLSFSMFKNIQYRLTITNTTSGVASTKSLFPSDSEYVIYVRTTGQTAANNTLATRNATLPWYSVNSTHINLNMTYIDTSLCTSQLVFRVWFRDNGTEVHNTTWSGFGASKVYDNHTIAKSPLGMEYLWQYNASTVC